tara:strand:- start:67 stop:603 length:537 start_codon:yes stop_codon:yes gene_type:complete
VVLPFQYDLCPLFFARWDSNNVNFIFLGEGIIKEFDDGVEIEGGKTAIRSKIKIKSDFISLLHEGILVSTEDILLPSYGKKISVVINRYERNPEFRRQCLEYYGYKCQICDFSFAETFGELGEDFCHVHHIEPIGESGGEFITDPIKDLIPVCPNCHAMLHRASPALKPDQLRSILKK